MTKKQNKVTEYLVNPTVYAIGNVTPGQLFNSTTPGMYTTTNSPGDNTYTGNSVVNINLNQHQNVGANLNMNGNNNNTNTNNTNKHQLEMVAKQIEMNNGENEFNDKINHNITENNNGPHVINVIAGPDMPETEKITRNLSNSLDVDVDDLFVKKQSNEGEYLETEGN